MAQNAWVLYELSIRPASKKQRPYQDGHRKAEDQYRNVMHRCRRARTAERASGCPPQTSQASRLRNLSRQLYITQGSLQLPYSHLHLVVYAQYLALRPTLSSAAFSSGLVYEAICPRPSEPTRLPDGEPNAERDVGWCRLLGVACISAAEYALSHCPKQEAVVDALSASVRSRRERAEAR